MHVVKRDLEESGLPGPLLVHQGFPFCVPRSQLVHSCYSGLLAFSHRSALCLYVAFEMLSGFVVVGLLYTEMTERVLAVLQFQIHCLLTGNSVVQPFPFYCSRIFETIPNEPCSH